MTPLRRWNQALIACLPVSGDASDTAASGWEIDATGFVTRVIDGDTFATDSIGRVRPADIDTPEVGKPGAAEATSYLIVLVYRRWVYLDGDDLSGTDRYGRLLAVDYVHHHATHSLNVNEGLLRAGHARVWDSPNEFDPATWSLYVDDLAEEMSIVDGLNRDQAVGVGILVTSFAATYLAHPLLRGRKSL